VSSNYWLCVSTEVSGNEYMASDMAIMCYFNGLTASTIFHRHHQYCDKGHDNYVV